MERFSLFVLGGFVTNLDCVRRLLKGVALGLISLIILLALTIYDDILHYIVVAERINKLESKLHASNFQAGDIGKELSADVMRFLRRSESIRKAIQASGVDPVFVLSAVEKRLPAKVWLTSFEFERVASELRITVQAYEKQDVMHFITSLESEAWVREVILEEDKTRAALHAFFVTVKV